MDSSMSIEDNKRLFEWYRVLYVILTCLLNAGSFISYYYKNWGLIKNNFPSSHIKVGQR